MLAVNVETLSFVYAWKQTYTKKNGERLTIHELFCGGTSYLWAYTSELDQVKSQSVIAQAWLALWNKVCSCCVCVCGAIFI